MSHYHLHMRNAKGQFVNGLPFELRLPVGTIRIRTRHKRGGEQRAWMKVAEPNGWRLLGQVVWEKHHGAIPRGMCIHHRDGHKLNDSLENLSLISKQKHFALHRHQFDKRRIQRATSVRRRIRWSTRSANASWTEVIMRAAIAAYQKRDGSARSIAAKFEVPEWTLRRRLKAQGLLPPK